jgi:hypothetical protein
MQILPPDTIPPIKWREFSKMENRNWDRFRSLITGEAFPAK